MFHRVDHRKSIIDLKRLSIKDHEWCFSRLYCWALLILDLCALTVYFLQYTSTFSIHMLSTPAFLFQNVTLKIVFLVMKGF